MADQSASPRPGLPSGSSSPKEKSIGIIQALTNEFEPLPEDIMEDIRAFCYYIVRTGLEYR